MKKKNLLKLISAFQLFMVSCSYNNILYKENITWINKDFNIEVTSEQLKNENESSQLDGINYYNKISTLGETYSCVLMFEYTGRFGILLFNEDDDSIVNFYGNDNQFFLDGWYKIVESKASDNKYLINVSLKGGQYLNYCRDNDIFFPYEITFYGYENKE